MCCGVKVQSEISGKCAAAHHGAARSGALVMSVAWVGSRNVEARLLVGVSWCVMVPSGRSQMSDVCSAHLTVRSGV